MSYKHGGLFLIDTSVGTIRYIIKISDVPIPAMYTVAHTACASENSDILYWIDMSTEIFAYNYLLRFCTVLARYLSSS